MKKFILILGALATVACTPTTAIPRLEQANKALEVEVDTALEFTLKRLCSLPVDTMGRQTEDADMVKAVFYACPQVRSLTLNILRAVGTDSFNVDVTVGVPE